MLAGQCGCVWIAYTQFPQTNGPHTANNMKAWTRTQQGFPPTAGPAPNQVAKDPRVRGRERSALEGKGKKCTVTGVCCSAITSLPTIKKIQHNSGKAY